MDTAEFKTMVDRARVRVEQEAEIQRRREEEYVRQNWPRAVTTESGLQYAMVRDGTGEAPGAGARLTLRYTGHSLDGLRFRSADDGAPTFGAEGEPFAFEVGAGGVSRGFDEGAADMRRGELRILILPAALAYGRSGHYARDVPGEKRFHISPNTMLVYEVERLDR